MTTYEFPSTVAMDPTLNTLVTDGQGYIYALSDPGFTSPLVIRDRFGSEMNGVRTTYNGVTEEFFADDNPIVWWSSGPYSFLVVSFTSLVEAANQAASAAQAAQAAAESATAAGDSVVAGYVNTPTSNTRNAIDSILSGFGKVPAGGTAGQVLSKSTIADFDSKWIDAPTGSGGGVPATGGVMFASGSSSARPTANTATMVIWIADTAPIHALVGDVWLNAPS